MVAKGAQQSTPRRGRFRDSIAWRLTLWFLVLSFLPFAVMAVFVRRNVSEGLAGLAAAEAEAQAKLLAAEAAMSVDGDDYFSLVDLAETDERSIAEMSPDGTYARHTTDGLEGTSAAGDLGEDTVREVLSGTSGHIAQSGRGRMLGYAPIPGGDGVIVVSANMKLVSATLSRLERSSSLQLAVSLALASVAGGIAIWIVIGPIQRLTSAAQQIGAGNLDVEIDTSGMEGELEVLAEAFAAMGRRLRGWYAELERRVADRTHELELLSESEHRRAEQFRLISEVGRHIASIMPVDELLGQVVTLIRDAYDYYHVGIGLVMGDEVVYRAGAGALWDDLEYEFRPRRLKVGVSGLTGWVAGTGESLIVPDVREDPRYIEMRGSGTRSELLVPIKAQDRVIGVLDVQSDELDAFSGGDLMVLRALADQAAIAILNARLYEQTKQLAVIEERQRLARDLHDSVTQSMYGVTLYAEAATRLLRSGNVELATEHLAQLRQTGQEALQEMRLLVFELRPPVLEEEGLVAGLQARLDAVEGRSGLATDLAADLPESLSAETEETLYRIAQEALNNCLKHAGASRIGVRLWQEGGKTMMIVSDDGAGFDPAAAEVGPGMGLRGMAERAAELGGSLRVDSEPGRGTLVGVEVPT